MTTTSTFPASSSNCPNSGNGPKSGSSLRLGAALVRWTGRAEGDLGVTADGDVQDRRQAVQAGPWAWLHQVHGAAVHVIARPGGVQGEDGDALVTAVADAPLAVFTADCAPVALACDERVVGMVHAGWRGLEAGVIGAAISTMRQLGATDVVAAIGPCIHRCCYEFGETDLRRLAGQFGDEVEGRTTGGGLALDIPAAVRRALTTAGVANITDIGSCTACGTDWFSHRARGERERQASVILLQPTNGG